MTSILLLLHTLLLRNKWVFSFEMYGAGKVPFLILQVPNMNAFRPFLQIHFMLSQGPFFFSNSRALLCSVRTLRQPFVCPYIPQGTILKSHYLKLFIWFCNQNLGKYWSRGGSHSADMSSFPALCGEIIDRKGGWEEKKGREPFISVTGVGLRACRWVCIVAAVIGAIQPWE